jgi:vacuolar-type H+-ATPase subunit I/STV1
MPQKRKTVSKRKPARKRTKPVAGGSQLAQLRSMVSQLRIRIEKEARARKFDSRLISEAKRARDEIVRQVTSLRDQGKKLAEQLQGTLTDAKKREKARQDALAMVTELREELARKTEDLRLKTVELRNLAQESAQRAREIIQGAPPPPSSGEAGTKEER